MKTRPPVQDWQTDFDHFDPTFVANPYPIYDELRRECPVAHSERLHGYWIPTRYEDLAAIAHDPSTFSSRQVVITDTNMMMMSDGAGYGAPPITSDPPFHTYFRRLLLPAFSPPRVAEWEPRTRKICNDLIDKFIDKGSCDAATEYAQHIPATVISTMLGIPPEDDDRFAYWIHQLLEVMPTDPEGSFGAIMEMFEYLRLKVEDHKLHPHDDIISYLLDAQAESLQNGGEPIEDATILGACVLMLIAGIDTTWSSIGSAIWHLSQNPDDLKRLVNEPELMNTAVEEFLRAYSPVTMAREVLHDTEYKGCPMKKGDRLLMPFPSANRDPEMFPNPDEFIIDRVENRHLAFGVGIHRCLGSNLARMELRVAIEEFIRRSPEFHLADAGAVTWSAGSVRGPRRLPIVFDRVA